MNSKNINSRQLIDEITMILNNLKDNKISINILSIILKLSDTLRIRSYMGDDKDSDFIDFENIPENLGGHFLPVLIEGIRKKKVLELYYQPFYEEKPYFIRVHPYLLKEYRFRWYLIGMNEIKKELRTYGLDRIWDIKETNLPYIQKNFKTRDYFKNTVGIISPKGDPPRVKIEVLKPQAFYLITQPLHPSQTIEAEDDRFIKFNYRVHPTYEFKVLLLGLGCDVKVLEPAGLQNEIIRELQEALKKYAKDIKMNS